MQQRDPAPGISRNLGREFLPAPGFPIENISNPLQIPRGRADIEVRDNQ